VATAEGVVAQQPRLTANRSTAAPSASTFPSQPAPSRTPRDLRIDFFRGIALLVMVVDHNEQFLEISLLSLVTYAPIGITTGAAAFVFLSGVVLGLASVPILDRRGYPLLQLRCLVRAWQLYVIQLFALVVCVTLATLLPIVIYGEPASSPIVDITNEFIAKFATLRTSLAYFDILPLYMVFLVFAPAFLAVAVKRPWAACGASFSIYALVQASYLAGRSHELPFAGILYYQPLAWQFLFAIGLLVGVARRQGWLHIRISRRQLIGVCVVLALVGAWYKLARLNAVTGWLAPVQWQPQQVVPFDVPGIDKSTLGPVRVLHFLAVAAVLATIVPATAAWLNNAWSRTIRRCGRHSLEVFVTGVILNYACLAAMPADGFGRATVLALDIAVVLLSLAAAFVIEYVKRQPWNMAAQ
jgi:hypothetical protein